MKCDDDEAEEMQKAHTKKKTPNFKPRLYKASAGVCSAHTHTRA